MAASSFTCKLPHPSTLQTVFPGPTSPGTTSLRGLSRQPNYPQLSIRLRPITVSISSRPTKFIHAAEASRQTSFGVGDTYSQVGKREETTNLHRTRENSPYKVLMETEGQGSIPPGDDNIRVGYNGHQLPHNILTEKEGEDSVPGENNISVGYSNYQETQLEVEKKRVLLMGDKEIAMKIAEIAVQDGYPTSVLVSNTTPPDSSQSRNVEDMGVKLILGDLDNHEGLVKELKDFDVVISVVGYAELTDQNKIINAIIEAGNIERFIILAEFINPGNAVDPAGLMYENLVLLKQNVETARIPYTFISYNFHAADKITISGDGNLKAEVVVAKFTVKSINDPRTINKILYITE